MKIRASFLSGMIMVIFITACSTQMKNELNTMRVRQVVDTVGFAHLDWQMDSITSRISTEFGEQLDEVKQSPETSWRAAICPHDDYTYTSWLYPAVLKNIKAKTIFIFGVAHKAGQFKLENRIVFDSYDAWQGPYGEIKVSPLRNKIIQKLPEDLYAVHDSMQTIEHSVESMIPYLQQQNPDIEIVSILVPYMPISKMDEISVQLASAIHSVAEEGWKWGKDYSILITSDAVHYGDEEWGGANYAPYGCDSAGYQQAVAHEHEIIQNCFSGELGNEKADRFYQYTVQDNDFHTYKWTWCGRYSVPMGLKTANQLQKLSNATPLVGIPLGYETSISQKHIEVDDLDMGRTAIAIPHHWVGYAAVGFK